MSENLPCWIALNLVLCEKLKFSSKIVQHFASVQDVFHCRPDELMALGVDRESVRLLHSSKIWKKARREMDWLREKGYWVLTQEDEAYPEYLREIFDPPLVLYCAGDVDVLKEPAVSIVGARKPSPYGRAVAERIAQDLASRGIVVVSGMARGIDSLAHWGALKAEGGKTVAVLGSGLNVVYPKEHQGLFSKIIEKGVVVTEYPSGALPLGFHFPLRNRIISGLSLGLVVVEATIKSGSLISARLALEQNREVMAVPGNVTSELSVGTNWLIQNGAKLVGKWEDVAEELPSSLRERLLAQKDEKKYDVPELTSSEKILYQLLKPDALIHIDEIVERSEFSVSEVLSELLSLELKGLVFQSPGKYFQRTL